MYLGTGSLLFVGNHKFRVIMNGRVGRKYFFSGKNEFLNYMLIHDNFPDLAGAISFIVTKGNDGEEENGVNRLLRSMKDTSRRQMKIKLLSLII